MKKYILILFIVLFLTGCSAEYTINVDSDFYEVLNLFPDSKGETDTLKNYNYREPAYYDPTYFEDELEVLPQIERYNVTFNNNVLLLSYKFGDKYQKSNIANSAVSSFSFYNGSSGHIYADDFSTAFAKMNTLKKITINIVTNKFVINHNADYVNGNKYTWVITKNKSKRKLVFNYNGDGGQASPGNNMNQQQIDNKDTPNNKTPEKNKEDNKNTKTDTKDSNKNTEISKSNNMILYVLYTLFFGSIFVIIVFRKKFK